MSKVTIRIVLGVAVFAALAAGLELVGVEWTRFIGEKKEDARREVFEETKSYNQGKIQDLAKYYQEYQSASTEEDRAAIKSYIQMQFADFDIENLSTQPTLSTFLTTCRGY